MNVQDFIKKIEAEFIKDVKPGVLKPESKIREHLAWDSINALIVIAMVNVEYGVTLEADDLINSESVNDVFSIVKQRAGENVNN